MVEVAFSADPVKDPLRVSARWRRWLLRAIAMVFILLLATARPSAAEETAGPPPGADKNLADGPFTLSIARATWDTGWFQTEIFIHLFEQLGYEVGYPETMDNLSFYLAAAKGEVDLWVNGWFPSHNVFLKQEGVRGRVTPVGFEVVDGALQGYLVDRATAERIGMKGLADLRNPAVAALFDRDGDGKADLIGCNTGWGCERVIEHHLGVYDLRATVEHVQGDYSPLMDETARRYREGNPVLFYTWTPNWTVGELVPGKDVVWMEVPYPSLPLDQQDQEEQTVIGGVPGCASDPCAMGFPPNDIRGVANTHFLDGHPDIRRLLESVTIPLEDISQQNARMIRGEDTYEDIRRHAREWIATNFNKVQVWLGEARSLQSGGRGKVAAKDESEGDRKSESLRVVTLRSAPFVVYRDGAYDGFTVELWERIAREIGVTYSIYGVNTIAKLLDDLHRGVADIAVAGIGITSERERVLDFSHPYFVAGLQIMVPEGSGSVLREVLAKIHSVVFSPEALYAVGIFFVVLLLAAHVIWMLESGDNPQFPKTYLRGLWESVWWAVVTVTTVGYGDKTPKKAIGRLFGIVWILSGYFVFAYFTASVTTTATVQELHGTINGPQDLYGKKVASVEKSTAAAYLSGQGISATLVENVDSAYHLLETGKVEAVVYDAPVLQHHAATRGKGKVGVVGLVFQEKNYGLVFPFDSIYRDKVNVAFLKLVEGGVYQQINEKWFGS
jgi:ABC-type proline/glycine betaine transport system substrate-binding protein/ABC-type amino acid transport substrate-binding protein